MTVKRGSADADKSVDSRTNVAPWTASPFIGRESELASLNVALETVLSGTGAVVVLAGEPGIGKTRTAAAFISTAAKSGAQVNEGICYDLQAPSPYWPWVQMLSTAIGNVDEDRICASLGDDATAIAEIVPRFAHLVQDPSPSFRPDPQYARARLFESIAAFWRLLSDNAPLVLVLENLHSADADSLDLLAFLAQELHGSPVFIIGTYRDTELQRQVALGRALGELARVPGYRHLVLRGLSESEVEQYVRDVSGLKEVEELAFEIHKSTAGNPLYVSEVVRLLEEEGRLRDPNEVTGTLQVRIPETVRQAIWSRIDRLSERCRPTLSVAAVIGSEFRLRDLTAVARDLTNDRALTLLEEALGARLVVEGEGPDSGFIFAHEVVRDTLLEGMSRARRSALHLSVAEVLEELYKHDLAAHAPEIANHYREAGSITGTHKDFQYSRLAGERALNVYAFQEAIVHFQRGFAAKSKLEKDEAASLWFGMARAQSMSAAGANETSESWSSLRRAFDLYVKADEPERAVEVALEQLDITFGPGDFTSIYDRALELVPPDSANFAKLLALKAWALIVISDRSEEAEHAFEKALDIAARLGDSDLDDFILNRTFRVRKRNEAMGDWVERVERAIELAERNGDFLNAYDACYIAAGGYKTLGKPNRAREMARRSVRGAERLRSVNALSNALDCVMTVAYSIGDWATLSESYERVVEIDPTNGFVFASRALTAYQTGDIDAGEEILQMCLDIGDVAPFGKVLGSIYAAEAIAVSAYITGVKDRIPEARRRADAYLEARIGSKSSRIGLALISVIRGDVEAATAQYSFFLENPLSDGWLLCDARRVLGVLARTIGDVSSASVHFEDALQFCRNAGYRPELAWTCSDYAEMLLDGDDPAGRSKALKLQDEALQIADELGMKPLADRISAAQSRIKRGKPSYPDGLTARQVEVLRLVAHGQSNKEIARRLFLSVKTVENHVANIYGKINAHGRVEAASYAARNELEDFNLSRR